MKSKVALVECPNYQAENIDGAVRRVIELIGGIDSIIKPNSKVLVKPNLLTDSSPEDCVTTHPRVVEAVINVLKKVSAEICVGDSPGVIGRGKSAESVYEATGIKEVCQRQDVELAYFDKVVVKNSFPLTDWVDKCDYIVNVPKFKTHSITTLTAAVKNLYGLVLGYHKARLHKERVTPKEFSKVIVDIFSQAKPALTVVDGVVVLEGEGPGSAGTKRDAGLILAGEDAVSVDSVLAAVMGLFPTDIYTTKEAASRGLGQADLQNIEIEGGELGEFIKDKFKLPSAYFYHKLPAPLLHIAGRLIAYKMQISHSSCQACGKCEEICPQHAIHSQEKRVFIDPRACILCACCQEVCPYRAINIKKSLLLKLLGA